MIKTTLFIIGTILISLLLIFGGDQLYTRLVHSKPVISGSSTSRDASNQDASKQSLSTSNTNKTGSPVSGHLLQVKSTIDKNVIKQAYEINGFDWSLPKNTKAEENSGLIGVYENKLDFAQNVFAIVRWDEANPQRGKYDFSKFEKHLQQSSPKKTLVRLEVNSLCEAPKWTHRLLRSSPDKSLIYWDQSYLDHLEPFINAFGQRYANDPRIIGVQLGIGDGEYRNDSCEFSQKDGWGEFWMTPQAIAEAQQDHGFNPEVFEKKTKQIIDIYKRAFVGNAGKLAFANIGPTYSWTEISLPYNRKLKSIADYVWQSGIGNRDGNIEIWMRYIDKAYGVELKSESDGTCSLGFDEEYAEVLKSRYSGTENEFYGKKQYVFNENGPYKNQAYRFMVSSMRALQMRRNFFSIADDSMALIKDPIYKTQRFLTYLNKVLGKQIENTPDVFILLGERYVAPYRLESFANEACVDSNRGASIRSFGRWLTETSNSKPSIRVSMPESERYWGQNYTMPAGIDYEYSARESNKFEFNINDKLIDNRCKNGCKSEVKMTYKDSAVTDLNISYVDSSGELMLQRYKTKGDNKIKTVTFSVNSPFKNNNANLTGSDFVVSSKTPIPLIMLRVNFL